LVPAIEPVAEPDGTTNDAENEPVLPVVTDGGVVAIVEPSNVYGYLGVSGKAGTSNSHR